MSKLLSYKKWVAALLLSSLLTACQVAIFDTHPHHPADDYYYYDYYPSIGVYFDTRYNVYYYRDRDRWIRTKTLPRRYNLSRHKRYDLRMKHAKPYEYRSNWKSYRYDRKDRRRR